MEDANVAKKKKAHSEYCAACGCSNSRQHHPSLSFFRFPLDPERCRRWVINSRRLDILEGPRKRTPEQLHRSYVLCSEHFEQSQFTNTKRNRLNRGTAVPTIFNVPNPPPRLTPKRQAPRKRPLPATSTTISSACPGIQIVCCDNTQASSSSQMLSNDATPTPPPYADHLYAPTPAKTTERKPLSPKKAALKKELDALRKQMKRRDNKIKKLTSEVEKLRGDKLNLVTVKKELRKCLNKSAYNFVVCQIEMRGKKKGFRWSDDMKKLSLSVLNASPKTYGILRKIFSLPARSTLKRVMQGVDVDTGFCGNILEAFENKVSAMPENYRLCSLIFDEMTIKESVTYNKRKDRVDGFEDFGPFLRTKCIANHATVFMARGIISKWKQPFGYFFSSGPIKDVMLKDLIKEAISQLTSIGLIVKCVICDQGSNNRSAIKSLGVSVSTPFFNHHDERVYVIFDPPHLLKNIRNNFKRTGFTVDGIDIEWKFLEEFYELDSKITHRLAPKLTKRHLDLPPFSTLRVKLAAQTLSHSTYAGMSTLIDLKQLTPSAQPTADFIKRIDSLFNCFNVQSRHSKKPFCHAISPASSHIPFLEDCLQWLTTVKTKSAIKQLPCIEGWKLSICSLLALVKDLCCNRSIEFLLTNRLNQDCIENLFSVIRGKGGHADNPCVMEFHSAIQKTMVDLIFSSSDNKNCQDDVDSFLVQLSSRKATSEPSPALPSISEATIDSPDIEMTLADLCPQLDLQRDNTLTYIGGYVLKKLADKLCQPCHQMFSGVLKDSDKTQTLVRHKQFEDCEKGLKIPSSSFLSLIKDLEDSYRGVCQQAIHSLYVKKTIVNRLLGRTQTACESCRWLIIKLYVNIRFHHSLKLSNQEFKTCGVRRNRKMMKLMHL